MAKRPDKPASLTYNEAKSNMTMAIRNFARAYKLPLFLMAAITADIAAEYQREAANEHSVEAERYQEELENYYEEIINTPDEVEEETQQPEE